VNCRNLLQNIFRGHVTGGFVTAASIMIAFTALTATTQVFAESVLDSSSAPATDYALPPPKGSLIEPAMPDDPPTEEAMPDEDRGSNAISNAAVPSNPMAAAKTRVTAADNGSARDESHSGWNRVGDDDADMEDDDQADKVLEVPQALPSADPEPFDDLGQTALQDGSQPPDDQDPTPDQVGSIEDYQDEEEGALMGVYGVPVLIEQVGIKPFGVTAFHARPYRRDGFGQRFQRGFVPIVPRPFVGTNSGILPTGPMFPSGSVRFSGAMPFPHGIGFSGGMRGGRR
jgi:hypothetical protein